MQVAKYNVTFEANKLPCATKALFNANNCGALDSRPYWVADWGLIHNLVHRTGHPMVCLKGDVYLVAN